MVDVVLYASTVISTVNQVDVVGLPPEVAEIVTVTAKMSTQVVQVSPSVQEQIEEEQGKVRALLEKYLPGDLRCTDLISPCWMTSLSGSGSGVFLHLSMRW